MRFHERVYEVAVLLGDPSAPPLWGWAAWQQAAAALDPLVLAARGPAAVRSRQVPSGAREEIRFGRIGWNAAGHAKWTHGSPASGDASLSWRFSSVEAWAPAWTACEREGRAPDVFLDVQSERALTMRREAFAFEPVVVLAVAADLGAGEQAEAAVEALRRLTRARLVASSRRPWGRSFGGGFTDALQDLALTHLFVHGDRHARAVDVSTLKGEWTRR